MRPVLLRDPAEAGFQQAGLHPSCWRHGAAAIPGVIGGSVQVGYANVYSLCEAHLKGVPITLVARACLYDAERIPEIAGQRRRTIHAQKDLVGKVVAVSSLATCLRLRCRLG